MKLTNNEKKILAEIKACGEISSKRVKEMIGTAKGKKALTKANFPNVRNLLSAHMTAYHHGMYRGGYAWISVISWSGDVASFKKFCTEYGI